MNATDYVVTEVLVAPYYQYDKWWVTVKADSYGRVTENTLMFDDREQAQQVTIGTKFTT